MVSAFIDNKPVKCSYLLLYFCFQNNISETKHIAWRFDAIFVVCISTFDLLQHFERLKMLYSSTSCVSLISHTCNTASSSPWSKLLFAGRVLSSGVINTSHNQQNIQKISSTSSPARYIYTRKDNTEQDKNRLLTNNFLSRKKLFSSSTHFKGAEMERFALANKYKGLDYNVWWVFDGLSKPTVLTTNNIYNIELHIQYLTIFYWL